MKVGVLGSGIVGKVLAAGFARHGHEVMIGSRSPEQLVDWLRENPGAGSGLFGDVAAFADVIVLAVKPQVMRKVCEGLAATVQKARPLIVSVAAGIRSVDIDAHDRAA